MSQAVFPEIAVPVLRQWLAGPEEVAFIDIREEGEFGNGHALLAANIPYSVLEDRIAAAVPRLETRIVLQSDDDKRSRQAARRLAALGYRQVGIAVGGLAAWQADGHPLFAGVNVPSKAFAEWVEVGRHTPSVEAEVLRQRQAAGEDIIILDGRTPEEFANHHVPGAQSCPNAELIHRYEALGVRPETTVVVSCAGRTRGIIGAQSLIDAGVANRVEVLSGGTQGWRLAGFGFDADPPQPLPETDAATRAASLARARSLLAAVQVPVLTAAELSAWAADHERTLYVFDVRSKEEFERASVPGARWVAGGQLAQSLDAYAVTRGARIALYDDQLARAAFAAYWLSQLGWDVVVLQQAEGFAAAASAAQAPALPAAVTKIDAAAAAGWLARGALALSADRSAVHRAGHVAGASWVNRAGLAAVHNAALAAPAVLVFARDAALAQGVVSDLAEAGVPQVLWVQGGPAQWQDGGLSLAVTPDVPADEARIDYLFWLHDRHSGNLASSRAYLQWELDLPAAVQADGIHGFRLVPAPVAGAAA